MYEYVQITTKKYQQTEMLVKKCERVFRARYPKCVKQAPWMKETKALIFNYNFNFSVEISSRCNALASSIILQRCQTFQTYFPSFSARKHKQSHWAIFSRLCLHLPVFAHCFSRINIHIHSILCRIIIKGNNRRCVHCSTLISNTFRM